jgi:hypothetical protein
MLSQEKALVQPKKGIKFATDVIALQNVRALPFVNLYCTDSSSLWGL